jgi:hypothetical protein
MAAAGRHINLLTSLPQNKKPQEEQEQEEKKHQNIPKHSHTALTERFSTKTRNKFSEETEEGRRAGARARHRRCCETKAREEKRRERDPGERRGS